MTTVNVYLKSNPYPNGLPEIFLDTAVDLFEWGIQLNIGKKAIAIPWENILYVESVEE